MATTDRLTDLFASTSTDVILVSLANLEGKRGTMTPEERQARAWMFEEIERRYDVAEAMDAWADAEDPSELSYFEALLLALPKEAMA